MILEKQLRIPYGVADYIKVRKGNEYYQDKTHYLPLIEQAGRFLFLIRPRRFGKSLLQSVMECYYDINRRDQFDELFSGTWIHANPTDEKHQYMVLRFDFSQVSGSHLEALQQSFSDHIRLATDEFCYSYEQRLDPIFINGLRQEQQPDNKLSFINRHLKRLGYALYLFIDEYDNFANTLLTTEGRDAYQQLTHGRGFLRDFFAELKGATGATGGALSRLFITGVSPVTLDDVTSGFNIGLNISLDPSLNGLLGFNEAELNELFAAFGQNYAEHKPLMQQWYNHYRFSEEVKETITNSDMALYYLQALYRNGTPPKELIDTNIRTDYGKLRHLIQLDRKLNGSFEQLNQIINQGGITSAIKTSFPAELLANPDNFVSLLYYFGLLTHSTEQCEGRPHLVVPNQTVKQLMYSYIRDAIDDVGLFRPDLFKLGEKLHAFAWRAEWQAFFDHLSEQLKAHVGMRDYLNGEKMVQGFLLAYLNLNPWFYALSEQELGGGFVDLYLTPFYAKYPEMKHAWLIELKYLSKSDDTPKNAPN
ncbi:hypothetical protein D5085_15845 [Ectothiorhodospiraceae bacterium BW-2]|nr:hypothetical protein D5085_15845 [Ectothiorhodospiraceae bacterium BW-2]